MRSTPRIDREHRRKLLLKFLKKGMTRQEMADAFHVTATCIGNWLKAEKLADPKKVAGGHKSVETRLKKGA